MKMKRVISSIVVILLTIISTAVPSLAGSKNQINKNWRGLAIKGYDAVAYFKDGIPVEGSKNFEIEWKDAKWRFASAAHRDIFAANPERYAPRYGGYCAWAVAQGATADVDPANAWKIVDEQLYLNLNLKVKKLWEQDIESNIAKADANWPSVLK